MYPRNNFLEDFAVYAEPDDVVPFTRFCLDYWPYETGGKLYKYFRECIFLPITEAVVILPIFYLQRVIYQPTAQPRYLLRLLNINDLSLSEMIATAGNLFLLRRKILDLEETNKQYREVPPGAERRGDDNFCTEKNLAAFVTRTIFEMYGGKKPTPKEQQTYSIPEDHLWTWLGPIDPPIPSGKIFKPNDKERKEILEFIELAKDLGQKDPKCLARMLKYRYPNLSKTEVYDFVYPDKDATDKQKDSQATRWGITTAKRREKKEPRS